jgi:hypothetical protein
MGYSVEKYLGAYIKIPKGLDLMKAVYDWDEKIPEDRFIDAWSENCKSPSIWLSNYIDDNSIRDEDEFFEISLSSHYHTRQHNIEKFRQKFNLEIILLDRHDIYYEIDYGYISYVS